VDTKKIPSDGGDRQGGQEGKSDNNNLPLTARKVKREKSAAFKNLINNAKPKFSFKRYEKIFAEEIAAAANGNIKHDPDEGWRIFNPENGRLDPADKLVMLYIAEMAKRFISEATKIQDEYRREDVIKFGAKLLNAQGISNIERLLRNEPDVSATEADYSNEPHIVNCLGDVWGADMTTRRATAADMFLMSTSAGPAPGNPEKFNAFMDWFTCGDAELKNWLLTVTATALFGFPSRLIINLYGHGRNGKGTLLRLLYKLLGDYSTTLPRSLAVKSRYANNSKFDKGNLPYKRYAPCMDLKIEPGEKLNLDELKSIAGDGDIVPIERKFKAHFDRALYCKVFINSNDKIPVDAFGESERSRFRLVPCNAHIDEPDPGLEDGLQKEFPQILNLLLEKAGEWYANGRKLPPCAVIDKTTDEYFDKQDVLGQFLNDKCVRGEGLMTAKKELFNSYEVYLNREQGITRPSKMKNFAAALEKRGIFDDVQRINGRPERVFTGIALKENAGCYDVTKNSEFDILSHKKIISGTDMNSKNFCNIVTGSGEIPAKVKYDSEEQRKLWEDEKTLIY